MVYELVFAEYEMCIWVILLYMYKVRWPEMALIVLIVALVLIRLPARS